MEEQTVPSSGFSTQTDSYVADYSLKFSQYTFNGMVENIAVASNYGNLAETFDLSLLGDCYDDHDMATVPSPSWSPNNGMSETTCWHQSFYASSPSSAGDFNAYSPDCKPVILASNGNSPNHSAFETFEQKPNIDVLAASIGNGTGNRNLLLRQFLEDTSFQQKCNFKPMDLQSISLMGENDHVAMTNRNKANSDVARGNGVAREMANNNSNVSTGQDVGGCLELNQIEPVFSLAFEQMRSEIRNTCSALGISPDPMQWSCSNVQAWLNNTLSSLSGMTTMSNNSASAIDMCLRQFWNVEGRRLCSLSEEEFRRLDPINGDYIFAQLELWKMNVPANTMTLHSMPSGQQHSFDLDHLLLVSSLSPSGSTATSVNDCSASAMDDKDRKSPALSTDGSSIGSSSGSEHAFSPGRSSSSYPSPCRAMQTDDEEEIESEEDIKPALPILTSATSGGASKAKAKGGPAKSGAHIHLWQFLKELLSSPEQHGSCIRWLDQSRGVFKIEDSVRVARLWGLRKNRPAMNYDKLSRSIRQYYRKGIMRKTERSQRLVYQFCHPYGL